MGEDAISAWAKTERDAVVADHQSLPPQELGGYGRCMADFAWGLQQRGHTLQVLAAMRPISGRAPQDRAASRWIGACT